MEILFKNMRIGDLFTEKVHEGDSDIVGLYLVVDINHERDTFDLFALADSFTYKSKFYPNCSPIQNYYEKVN